MIRQPLWTGGEVKTATGAEGTTDWGADGVSIDSRTVKPGDLFIALKGPNFDGNDYLKDAFEAGAVAALANRSLPDRPVLKVADTLVALHGLGRAARTRAAARFIAVTGSVGKTGTKEALRLALGAQRPTVASEGNLNNQWGAPLSLARMDPAAEFGVFELGMNHAGEIRPLAKLVRPEIAVITTIAPVHTAFFPSLEAVADAKAEIFEGVEAGGAALINRDLALYERLSSRAQDCAIARIIGFGADKRAEARLIACRLGPDSSEIEADILGTRIAYRLPLPGRHLALNSLAVLAAVALAGLDLARAGESLARLQPLKGRGQRVTIVTPEGPFELYDESYNASPAAVCAALAVLGRAPVGVGGRRIAILGDMLELGPAAEEFHAALAADIRANRIDLVFTCGPLSAALDRALPKAKRAGHGENARELLDVLKGALRAGDAVLVKGSLGMGMSAIVDALKAGMAPRPRAANGR